MKPETKVWIKLDNIGRPADKITMQCSTREAIMLISQWLLKAYMGQKIRITLARTEDELIESKRSETLESMTSDLESLLANPPDTEAP